MQLIEGGDNFFDYFYFYQLENCEGLPNSMLQSLLKVEFVMMHIGCS